VSAAKTTAAEPQDIAALIVRSVCESDPADPEHADTVCVNVNDLAAMIVTHLPRWQPIATAPKHTPIRLYAQGGGFYDEDFNPSGSVEGLWSDDIGWSGAFWDGEHDCWQRRDDIVPTHWMPLPEPLAIDRLAAPEARSAK
jgi:hypothetical protein